MLRLFVELLVFDLSRLGRDIRTILGGLLAGSCQLRRVILPRLGRSGGHNCACRRVVLFLKLDGWTDWAGTDDGTAERLAPLGADDGIWLATGQFQGWRWRLRGFIFGVSGLWVLEPEGSPESSSGTSRVGQNSFLRTLQISRQRRLPSLECWWPCKNRLEWKACMIWPVSPFVTSKI